MTHRKKVNLDYFPIDTKRRSSDSLNFLVHKFGLEGLGFYVRFLQYLADQKMCQQERTDAFKHKFSFENNVSPSKYDAIIKFLIDNGLLIVYKDKGKEVFYCKTLNRVLQNMFEANDKAARRMQAQRYKQKKDVRGNK